MAEIDAWKMQTEFSLYEASSLLLDNIPHDGIDKETKLNKSEEIVLTKLYQEIKTDIDGFFILCGYYATNQDQSYAYGDSEHKYYNPPYPQLIFPAQAYVIFAQLNELPCKTFSSTSALRKLRINRNGYRTKLLNVMDLAIEKFWLNYDPQEPDTAPKNEDVISFLLSKSCGEFKVSERIASAMATIIRHDSAPQSGRPSKNK